FVSELVPANRLAGLVIGVLDGDGADALTLLGNGFVDEGADHTAGKVATAVVDDDRGLLDLQRVVERLCQHFVAGVLATDDFHQRHLVDRAEEVDADKVRLVAHAFGEAGDRQRRGVGAEYGIRQHFVLDFLEDLVLEFGVLEHGFNNEVAALQVLGIGGRLDARQDFLFLLLGHLAAGDRLVEDLARVVLALLGVLNRDVLEHDFRASARGDVGNACAHHAGTEYGHFLGFILRHIFRAAGALVDGLQVEEERSDHVLRYLATHQAGEVAAFDLAGVVEIDLCAFHGGRHDGQRCRVVGALELLLQVGREGRQVHGQCRGLRVAARDLVAFYVPRLLRFRVGLDPGACLGEHVVAVSGQFVDDVQRLGFFRVHFVALQQHVHQRVLDAEHAHHAGDAAATGQQAQLHFRQTELGFRVVDGHAVMTRQRDFQATTERGAVQCGDDRLAEGFQGAQLRVDHVQALVEFRGLFLGDFQQVTQVTTGKEGFLGGGDDDTGDVVLLFYQTLNGGLHGFAIQLVHGVGGLVRVVKNQGDDIVRVFFPTNCSLFAH